VALDEALNALAALDPRKSQIVELRFFGGLSVEETAEVLKISPRTVKREWSVSQAWLHRELSKK
jgi:RNA polymerase sigma factor (sigma-70 family)